MSKINKKRLKTTAVLLAFLVLLQGCVVYHKTPRTLEQASQENSKTKITTLDNKTIRYKYIVEQAGNYYGITTEYGDEVKNPLNAEEIAEILTKDKKASTWTSVIAIGVPVIVVVILGLTASIGLEVDQNFIPK